MVGLFHQPNQNRVESSRHPHHHHPSRSWNLDRFDSRRSTGRRRERPSRAEIDWKVTIAIAPGSIGRFRVATASVVRLFRNRSRPSRAAKKRAVVGRTKRNKQQFHGRKAMRLARAKTRAHETDDDGTSSLTHTATKRRPAMTKGSTERDADEPTREDKDAGPSARASTGKRASIASTKVRFHDDYECGSSFFFPRVDGRTRTYEPSVQSARLVVLGGAFASLRAASDFVVIDVIDRWIDRSIVTRRSREIFLTH